MHLTGATSASDWRGFAVVGRRPARLSSDCDVPSPIKSGWQIELNGNGPRAWEELAREMLIGPEASSDAYLLTNGAGASCFRAAAFLDDCLVGALLVSPRRLEIDRDWLIARLGTDLGAGERFRLLDGRPSGAMTPRRRLVCYCHQIGDNEILEAVEAGCGTVEAVGRVTRAGTNCGTCQPRIAALLER